MQEVRQGDRTRCSCTKRTPCTYVPMMRSCVHRHFQNAKWVKQKKQIGHHARPRGSSATAPLHTGTDTWKTGSGARKRSGAKSDPVHRRSNHAQMEDQAGRRKRANIDAVGGWRVYTADGTPSRNAATRSKTVTSGAKGTYGQGQLLDRAGMGQNKPWQQKRGCDWPETPQATAPPRSPTQNTTGRGHPGEG